MSIKLFNIIELQAKYVLLDCFLPLKLHYQSIPNSKHVSGNDPSRYNSTYLVLWKKQFSYFDD